MCSDTRSLWILAAKDKGWTRDRIGSAFLIQPDAVALTNQQVKLNYVHKTWDPTPESESESELPILPLATHLKLVLTYLRSQRFADGQTLGPTSASAP